MPKIYVHIYANKPHKYKGSTSMDAVCEDLDHAHRVVWAYLNAYPAAQYGYIEICSIENEAYWPYTQYGKGWEWKLEGLDKIKPPIVRTMWRVKNDFSAYPKGDGRLGTICGDQRSQTTWHSHEGAKGHQDIILQLYPKTVSKIVRVVYRAKRWPVMS